VNPGATWENGFTPTGPDHWASECADTRGCVGSPLPTVPWEPQATDDELADALRRRGWVVYRKRPSMRRGKVRLRDGTVLVQTTVEEVVREG
jgi:hypothetical protein